MSVDIKIMGKSMNVNIFYYKLSQFIRIYPFVCFPRRSVMFRNIHGLYQNVVDNMNLKGSQVKFWDKI